MKKVFLVVAILAGVAYWQRDELKRWLTKQQWQAPDGSSLWDQLSTSLENLYDRDLFGDGREAGDKIDALQNAGVITFEDSGNNISNGGALLNQPITETDVGTRQTLAQIECRIAVTDYGMDPSEEAACVASVSERGRYGFTSNGVRMMVDIIGGSTSGQQATYTGTNPDMAGSSGNWQEITEG